MAQDRNYATFYALLAKMPGAEKEMIVRQYTNGRTGSLRDMNDDEYCIMVSALRRRVDGYDKLRQARSNALHRLQLYGVDTSNWDDVNRFCAQRRIAGKVFEKMNTEELISLTRKMRAIMDKGERKAQADARDEYIQEIVREIKTQQPS